VIDADALRTWLEANEFEVANLPEPPLAGEPFFLSWPAPFPAIVTQAYGINPQWYKPFGLPGHEGIDMRALNGTPIYAMADGEVSRVEPNAASGPYGIHVRLKHMHPDEGEFRTVYAHFEEIKVALGQKVIRGEVLGLSDNTGNSSGPHLHITLKHIGHGSPWMNTSDIVNPTPYLADLFPGKGWRLDVGGNLRKGPGESFEIIRWIPAGPTILAMDFNRMDGGDWWKIGIEGEVGWFWNPGYKLRAI
jgi:murein DD-endopeptidase MepM/ murein hydrolase activator NlpD